MGKVRYGVGGSRYERPQLAKWFPLVDLVGEADGSPWSTWSAKRTAAEAEKSRA